MNKTYIFFSILFLISIAVAQNEESGTTDTVNYIYVNGSNTTNSTNVTIIVRDPTVEEVIAICNQYPDRCPVDTVNITQYITQYKQIEIEFTEEEINGMFTDLGKLRDENTRLDGKITAVESKLSDLVKRSDKLEANLTTETPKKETDYRWIIIFGIIGAVALLIGIWLKRR